MIDGKNVIDQPVKNDLKTYENIQKKKRKNATGQGNDYKTGCLLDYNYFKKNSTSFWCWSKNNTTN